MDPAEPALAGACGPLTPNFLGGAGGRSGPLAERVKRKFRAWAGRKVRRRDPPSLGRNAYFVAICDGVRASSAAASFATAVPSKKFGFCVPQRWTVLAKTKSRKLSLVMWPSSSSS